MEVDKANPAPGQSDEEIVERALVELARLLGRRVARSGGHGGRTSETGSHEADQKRKSS